MANVPEFNLTGEALRKALIVWVDAADFGSSTPEWEPQGYKTEDASIEFSPETTEIVDILGIQHNTVDSLTRTIDFDPNTLRPIGNKGKVNQKLHEFMRRGMLAELSQFKVLITYGYLPETSNADMYPMCRVVANSLGGSSRVDMPISIAFGGDPEFGSVDKLTPGLIFTPENAI